MYIKISRYIGEWYYYIMAMKINYFIILMVKILLNT